MAATAARRRPPRWALRLAIALVLGGALGAAGGVMAVNRLEPGHLGGVDSLALFSVPAPAPSSSASATAPPRPASPSARPAGSADSAADPLALDPATIDSLARLDSLAAADSVAPPGGPPGRPDTLPRHPAPRPLVP